MRPLPLLVCILLFGSFTALAGVRPAESASSRLAPYDLRCEYQADPLGIDEPAPRLSWKLRSAHRAQTQTAYEIQAASSLRRLRRGEADLWRSGKVASDEQLHVVYAGKPLGSGQAAYWQVRVWDADGNRSGFSKTASWEMGLLRPEDWAAKWIGVGAHADGVTLEGLHWIWYPEGNPAQDAPVAPRDFYRTFTLPADARAARARLYLAADDAATVWINGKEAGQASDWHGVAAIDATPLLKAGKNELAVTARNAQGPAGLLGRLLIDLENGTSLTIDTDRGWKAAQIASRGWPTTGFDAGTWPAAMETAMNGAQPWGMVAAAPGPAPSPYLRTAFDIKKPVRRARLYAAALGLYELHLNGRRIDGAVAGTEGRPGMQLLAPGWTDYRQRVQYQTYDVTNLLQQGPNVLGAILGDGWYAGSLGFDLSRNHFGPSPPRLRAQLAVEYRDGSSTTIPTDRTWQGAASPILESDLYGGESYDARREVSGWDMASRDGGDYRAIDADFSQGPGRWFPATVYADQNPAMNAQVGPAIRLTNDLPTRAVTEPKPGVYVFDVGQNMVGWARLRVRGPAGTRVTLRFAEVLNRDGTVYRDNLRRARATDTYVLKGGDEEAWEPHFTYHGFRYVEVTGYPGAPSKEAITGRVFHSAMTPTSRFECSNRLVNRLYQNILWGQRGNLMSVPTDCPQRDERLGWMGDAQVFARSACWNMDMSGFFSKWTRDIVDAQSPEGAFSDVSPRVVDPADGAPAWAEAGLVIPWTIYECYADRRILERNWEPMHRYVDLLVQANPDLLWLRRRNNDFGDWVPAGETTNKNLIACAYLAYDLRLVSRAAAVLGKTGEARKYADLADRSRNAFNARFLSADGRYLGDTQTAYAMALEMRLVPPDRRADVGARLAEAVERRGSTLATGFIGTRFLLPALSDTGRDDLAFTILQNTRYPSWGYMIEKGATTIWELWDSDRQGPGMNSRNHFAFGSVAEWMQRYLAGIDTDDAVPGYRHFIIRPHTGHGITSARTEYDSAYGTILAEWSEDPGGLSLKGVPAGTTATLHLPQSRLVLEGRNPVWRDGSAVPGAAGVVASAEAHPNETVLELRSGTYAFHVHR